MPKIDLKDILSLLGIGALGFFIWKNRAELLERIKALELAKKEAVEKELARLKEEKECVI